MQVWQVYLEVRRSFTWLGQVEASTKEIALGKAQKLPGSNRPRRPGTRLTVRCEPPPVVIR
jgi:hypothetical protein